jgi:uncharacterized protein
MVGPSRIRHWLTQLLHTHDTPRRTAAAYAMGVFFGFSPVLGLHTVLGLVFAFVLGLNRVAVVLGVYSNLPWLVPAYYTLATIAGAALLGVTIPPGVLEEAMAAVSAISWGEFRDLFRTLSPLLWAFTLGSTLGAVLLAAIAYRVSLTMIVAHRRHVSHGPSEPADS